MEKHILYNINGNMKNLHIIAPIAAVLFLLCTIPALSAECLKISSVDSGNANVSLRYLQQTDTSSLVYAILSIPEDRSDAVLVNVSRVLYVTDGEVNYKLIGAQNIPVEDESMLEFSILEDQQKKLNFILEFEKFPIDGKFDIVDAASSGEGSLNFKGVCVDPTARKEVDPTRFTKSTDLPRCGRFFDEGRSTDYYVRDGVFVSLYTTYSNDHFTFHFSIVNKSDHGILFNTDKLKVTGHKNPKSPVEVDLPLISKGSYVNAVAMDDIATAKSETRSAAMSELGSALSFASIGLPWRSPERIGLDVLGGVVKDISYEKARPYIAELDKTRAERTKNYLQSQSLKPGESHIGFIQAQKTKKVRDYHIVLHMDGYDFEFVDSI